MSELPLLQGRDRDGEVRVVEFGLLGPLQVRAGATVVSISSAKLRIVLAALLLRAGRSVSVAELADTVWADDQPANPRRAVQLAITRLRAMLAPAALDKTIVTGPGCYLLAVGPQQTDVGRFHRWWKEAGRAGRRGDSAAEATALTEALAQWHGEPLADIPSESLHRETIPRLREQWLQALERRIDLDLRRGRHAELVGELMELTARYPLRESVWAKLMTALCRSDRRTEALNAYQSMRHSLAVELGISPSDELQNLHATILIGRAASAGQQVALIPPVPRQLPPDVIGFTGRAAEVTRLGALLPGIQGDGLPAPVVIIAIAGIAGVGKTALAAHWARRVADRFPDGQLWLNLRGYHPGHTVEPEQALTRLLLALGVPGPQIRRIWTIGPACTGR